MSVERVTEGMPIREGAVAGALAWVAGLVVVFVLSGAQWSLFQVLISYSQLHLWLLLIVPTNAILGLLLFSVIPMVILALAGYFVAARTGAEGWIPVGGAVAVGYLALAVPSHLLVFAPSVVLVIAVVFSGVLMPVVFAGLGGTFAGGSGGADDD